MTPPIIIVQVKSGEGEVNEATVSELSGKVSERDFGIFVPAGGFNKRARDFAFGKCNLKLIDGKRMMSTAARRKIGTFQKARWAKVKAGKKLLRSLTKPLLRAPHGQSAPIQRGPSALPRMQGFAY